MTIPEQLQLRRNELEGKLRSRRGKLGYGANIALLEQKLARLDQEIASLNASGPDGASLNPDP